MELAAKRTVARLRRNAPRLDWRPWFRPAAKGAPAPRGAALAPADETRVLRDWRIAVSVRVRAVAKSRPRFARTDQSHCTRRERSRPVPNAGARGRHSAAKSHTEATVPTDWRGSSASRRAAIKQDCSQHTSRTAASLLPRTLQAVHHVLQQRSAVIAPSTRAAVAPRRLRASVADARFAVRGRRSTAAAVAPRATGTADRCVPQSTHALRADVRKHAVECRRAHGPPRSGSIGRARRRRRGGRRLRYRSRGCGQRGRP